MKVLQSGSKVWTITKTCKSCEALLKAEESDIQYELTEEDLRSQQYNDDIEGSYFITCPECQNEIKIKTK